MSLAPKELTLTKNNIDTWLGESVRGLGLGLLRVRVRQANEV